MNEQILNTSVQEFIQENLNVDLRQLALKGTAFEGVTTIEILQQIQGKIKIKDKVPEWYSTPGIIFPEKINLEQSSSGITAGYKASLIEGKNLLDLTGGFGVDSYYFAKRFDHTVHCEINRELSEIAKHNFNALNVENVEFIPNNGMVFLEENPQLKFDWIYLDPARRNTQNKKVFQLKDTTPNILYHLEDLFAHTGQILLKTSPLLDISLGIKHLKNVREIHIVGVENEVKELLWIIEKEFDGVPVIKTVNFAKNKIDKFEFDYEAEKNSLPVLSSPLRYLYEPNACIMKSGGFNSLSEHYNLGKLHPHSHLYTSAELIDFPGRKFVIDEVVPYNKKNVKKRFGKHKHNITARNFTLKVSDIRHLFRIEDGGDSFLFFTTNKENKKIVLICSKPDS